jgi:hypothetical protein
MGINGCPRFIPLKWVSTISHHDLIHDFKWVSTISHDFPTISVTISRFTIHARFTILTIPSTILRPPRPRFPRFPSPTFNWSRICREIRLNSPGNFGLTGNDLACCFLPEIRCERCLEEGKELLFLFRQENDVVLFFRFRQ